MTETDDQSRVACIADGRSPNRSFVHGEASWDLIGLVLVGGAVGTAYRAQQGALSRRWMLVAGLSAAVALLLAAIMVLVARP